MIVESGRRTVHIDRGGLPTVRIGPFPTQRVAEQWLATLTEKIPDAAVTLGVHDPDQHHLDPDTIPAHVDDLIGQLPAHPCDAPPFPGLRLLLACKLGDATADYRWRVAEAVRDLEAALAAADPDQVAERALALTKVLRAHRPTPTATG